MPKKKGKKKSKKGSKKSAKSDNEAETLELEGEGAQLGIGKKKKAKKAKLSKEEKAAEKLAKKLQSFVANEKLYHTFLKKIDNWMIVNQERVHVLFKRFDVEADGIVQHEVFKAGLHDLDCPITDLEANALMRILDPENSGLIEYCGFERGIHNRRLEDDSEEEDEDLTPEDFVPELYQTKGVAERLADPFYDDYPRYLNISMVLATFHTTANHPNHLTMLVRSHAPISVVLKLVGELAHVTTGEMNIYAKKSCKKKDRLPLDKTLEECGFEGGPFRDPKALTLYYDYIVEYSDCPLLNCDHYFGQEKTPKNPILKAYPEIIRRRRNLSIE